VQATQRCRLSLWAGSALVDSTSLRLADRILDDISILQTVKYDLSTALPSLQLNPERNLDFGKIIHACHQMKIQCLAGFDVSGNDGNPSPRGVRMEKFLADLDDPGSTLFPESSAVIEGEAEDLVRNFVNKDWPVPGGGVTNFDGISFDVEALTTTNHTWGLRSLYVETGKALAALTGAQANKWVGVAAGGMISDSHVTNPSDSPGAFWLAHPYNLVNAQSNLVLRPMAYDAFSIVFNSPDPGITPSSPVQTSRIRSFSRFPDATGGNIRTWHNQVMDYAVASPAGPDHPAVAIEQFQLGVKIFPGGSNSPDAIDASGNVTDGKKTPVDHFRIILNGKTGGWLDSDVEILTRCREIRRRGMGLIVFAMQVTDFDNFFRRVAKWNWMLNAQVEPPAGWENNPTVAGSASGSDPKFDPNSPFDNTVLPGTISVPRQIPHTAESVARLST
jgi:hypothetical protein